MTYKQTEYFNYDKLPQNLKEEYIKIMKRWAGVEAVKKEILK